MELNSRQTYMLQAIVKEDEVLMDAILDKQKVCRRTLYYDLEKVNFWLNQNNLGKVISDGQSLRAEIENVAALNQIFRNKDVYYFSVSERQAMEIVYIALSSENITISSLINLFGVSKNTILADIKSIRVMLQGWGLVLSTTIKDGYQVQGEEMTIRKMLAEQFQLLSSPGAQACVQGFLQNSLVSFYDNEIDFGELCRCLISQYEADISGEYILANTQLIRIMIQVSWIRGRKSQVLKLSSDEQLALMKSLSFRSVEFSLQKLRIHGVEVAMQETYYITSLFLGIQTTDFLSQEQEDSFIDGYAEQLVLNFERIACLSFPNRSRLQKQLSHHIRPVYYRVKYGIPDKNPLVDDIKKLYPLVFEFTRRSIQATDAGFPAEAVSEDEMAYLCIYFVNNLNEKDLPAPNPDNAEVLIVGAENMAVATLLREQLQDLFGIYLNYRVISLNKLREWMLRNYVLVVSLVPLCTKYPNAKIIETEPIITPRTQHKIMEILRGVKPFARYDEMIQQIISRVKDSVTGDVLADKLYFDLFRYFDEKQRGKVDNIKTNIFTEKIAQTEFEQLPALADLQDALIICSKMLRHELASQRLAERMTNLYHSNKLHTYFIRQDVMLVHFPLQGDVDPKIDVCIVLAPQGVSCPDGNKVKIIIGMATKDSYSHWGELEDIYRYFSGKNYVDIIKQLL